jgi:endonuclease/exonuclease/phosphatase family metal-dependent hydrolase
VANDFPARAEAIADEIAAAKPDLVGLQEAALYRTDVPPDGPATRAEWRSTSSPRSKPPCKPAGSRTTPSRSTPARTPSFPPAFDLRLTDRVVVLARTDETTADLKLSNPQSGAYTTALRVNTVAGPLVLPRGWASVDVKIRGREFRFVTTHLEAFSGAIRNAQTAELLAGPAATDLPVVLVGDLNAGPGFDAGPYGTMLQNGFADAWEGGAGLTCCHAVDLHNPNPTLTKRIDLVLTRGGFETVSTQVVGAETADRTASGLWPSDHAGVVATLRLPEEPEEGDS